MSIEDDGLEECDRCGELRRDCVCNENDGFDCPHCGRDEDDCICGEDVDE